MSLQYAEVLFMKDVFNLLGNRIIYTNSLRTNRAIPIVTIVLIQFYSEEDGI